jgi:putative sigma-54 modulation protein
MWYTGYAPGEGSSPPRAEKSHGFHESCSHAERKGTIMKVSIVGRQINVYEETKKIIVKKLSKLDKYFQGDREPEAVVTLSRKRNVSTLEVTINAGGTLFRSEVDSDDFRNAIDKTVDNIERQIRKNKTRLEKKMRNSSWEMLFPDEKDSKEGLSSVQVEEEDPEAILRIKKFEYKPMSSEDAIMQMNLLGHSFFVYNDIDTGDTCVVYRRKDGAYGLIEPEK